LSSAFPRIFLNPKKQPNVKFIYGSRHHFQLSRSTLSNNHFIFSGSQEYTPSQHRYPPTENSSNDAEAFVCSNDANQPKCFSTKFSNLIVAYSTIPSYGSERNTKSGTYYIQALCDILKNVHSTNTKSMYELLDEVAGRLEISQNGKCTAEYKRYGPMKKKWYFPIRDSEN
jgi:hypothetical protein